MIGQVFLGQAHVFHGDDFFVGERFDFVDQVELHWARCIGGTGVFKGSADGITGGFVVFGAKPQATTRRGFD